MYDSIGALTHRFSQFADFNNVTVPPREREPPHLPKRNPCVTRLRYSCVMNVNDAAVELSVTPRRVRALIADGKIAAHKAGAHWEIDALPRERKTRPLSRRSQEHLVKALRSRSLRGIEGHERARTARRLHTLRTSRNPAAILLDWWGGHTDEHDIFFRSLLERALAGDSHGVRETLQRRQPAYLATTARLSDRITTERRIQGLTQEELANLAGVKTSAVRDLERGRAMSSPSPSRRVLKALNIVPSALPPMGASS